MVVSTKLDIVGFGRHKYETHSAHLKRCVIKSQVHELFRHQLPTKVDWSTKNIVSSKHAARPSGSATGSAQQRHFHMRTCNLDHYDQ